MTTPNLRESISRSPWRRGYLLIAVALCCFGLAPAVQAVSPPPDGGYPGNNTAEGDDALFSLTTGVQNTAIGFHALFNNNANKNTGNGYQALQSNTTGNTNTASGAFALFNNTTGVHNTATGVSALSFNRTGNGNVAVGDGALGSNTGSFNAAVGFNSGGNLTTGSNNIDIGSLGVAGESNTMRIGAVQTTATYITGISGATVPGGVGVIIDSTGHLGTVVSSERFKHEIKPMEGASEAIFALEPVTFRYKHELDPDGIPQFGLVAEDVEKVNPNLVARDGDGKPYTVRYDAVNAMLLNEFLKEHRRVEEQQATITQLKSTVAQQQKDLHATVSRQQKQIEALAAGLQKVSAQLEASKPAPQMANNP